MLYKRHKSITIDALLAAKYEWHILISTWYENSVVLNFNTLKNYWAKFFFEYNYADRLYAPDSLSVINNPFQKRITFLELDAT